MYKINSAYAKMRAILKSYNKNMSQYKESKLKSEYKRARENLKLALIEACYNGIIANNETDYLLKLIRREQAYNIDHYDPARARYISSLFEDLFAELLAEYKNMNK